MRKLTYLMACGVAVASLALAGCGSSGSTSGSGGAGDSGSSSAASDLQSINEQPRENLQEGGTLRLSIGEMPVTWNTSHVEGTKVDTNNIMAFISPSFLNFAPDGKWSYNPNFVESYDEQKPEGDKAQVITLHMNPKAKWNDGTPITWKDFQATWNANKVDDGPFNNATSDGYRNIASIEKGEKDTDVVVTFKDPYPDWSSVLSGTAPAPAVSDPATFNDGWNTENFHSEWMAGPYKINKVDMSQKTVELVPNEKWWGDKPLLDKVIFKEMDPAAQASGFANKEIDAVQGIITANTLNTVKQRSDAEVREAVGTQWRHFTLNAKTPNLSDVKVRQAIQVAMNREAMASSDLAGMNLDVKKLMLGNHFFMPGQDGYVDNGAKWSYDPKRAEKLLDEAGWKKVEGKDIREKDGKPLVIKYLMITGIPTSENEGKLLQQDLKKVGIDLQIKQIDSNSFFKSVKSFDYEITSFSWQGTPYPMNNIGQIYGTGSSSNYSQLSVPEVDQLRDQVDKELDQKKRKELTNEADALIWENVFNIPIYNRRDMAAVVKNLANYGAFGVPSASSVHAENVGFMKEGK